MDVFKTSQRHLVFTERKNHKMACDVFSTLWMYCLWFWYVTCLLRVKVKYIFLTPFVFYECLKDVSEASRACWGQEQMISSDHLLYLMDIWKMSHRRLPSREQKQNMTSFALYGHLSNSFCIFVRYCTTYCINKRRCRNVLYFYKLNVFVRF